MKPRTRQCPMCETRTRERWCCGIDLAVHRKPWRMTIERIRLVHVLARSRKGLDAETYRLRLRALGVESSKQLNRAQFHRFLRGLSELPDVPNWQSSIRRTPQRTQRARSRAA